MLKLLIVYNNNLICKTFNLEKVIFEHSFILKNKGSKIQSRFQIQYNTL